MIHSLETQRERVALACTRHRVRKLWVFGSAAGDRFDPGRSDIDLLVEFEPMPPAAHADHFFGLQEDLQSLLQRPVDLVELRPIRNPFFRQAVEATKVVLFDAA